MQRSLPLLSQSSHQNQCTHTLCSVLWTMFTRKKKKVFVWSSNQVLEWVVPAHNQLSTVSDTERRGPARYLVSEKNIFEKYYKCFKNIKVGLVIFLWTEKTLNKLFCVSVKKLWIKKLVFLCSPTTKVDKVYILLLQIYWFSSFLSCYHFSVIKSKVIFEREKKVWNILSPIFFLLVLVVSSEKKKKLGTKFWIHERKKVPATEVKKREYYSIVVAAAAHTHFIVAFNIFWVGNIHFPNHFFTKSSTQFFLLVFHLRKKKKNDAKSQKYIHEEKVENDDCVKIILVFFVIVLGYIQECASWIFFRKEENM